MLILLPLILLFLSVVIMIVLRFWRPRFSYFWITATASALLVWVVILIMRLQLPISLRFGLWLPMEIFPASPMLTVDIFSWPFALAIAVIHLASVLTGVASASPGEKASPNWMSWTGGLAITGLSLLAAFSANILAILLTWMLLDLVEFIIYLSLSGDRKESERATAKFSTRVAGILIGIWAYMVAYAQNSSLTLDQLTPVVSSLMIVAASRPPGDHPQFTHPALPFAVSARLWRFTTPDHHRRQFTAVGKSCSERRNAPVAKRNLDLDRFDSLVERNLMGRISG